MTFSRSSRWPALIASFIFLVMTVAVLLPELHHHSADHQAAGLGLVTEKHDCVFCKLLASFRSAELTAYGTSLQQELPNAAFQHRCFPGLFQLARHFPTSSRAPPVF